MYVYDWDGTLVESFGREPLDGARERLAALKRGARIVIVTNQAGPVFRLATGIDVATLAERLDGAWRRP